MESRFWVALAATIIAACVTTAGIYVIRRFRQWGRDKTGYFACFAAGVLIAVSFLHIVPVAFDMNEDAPIWLLAGYLSLHFFSRFVKGHVCGEASAHDHAVGLTAMLGIGFHSFIDGIVYAITFSVSVFTGTVAAVGMVLHEFPEGIVTYLLLVQGGFTERKSFRWAFITAGLSTPVGMLVSYPLISSITRPVLGALLAASGGALIYVGATHLLPRAEQEPKRYSVVALLAGILTAVGIVLSGH